MTDPTLPATPQTPERDAEARERLTRKQADVLFVVRNNGPVTPRDVADHLLISEGSARGVLARLERRCLIDATYTGHHRGMGRAYVARAAALSAKESHAT